MREGEPECRIEWPEPLKFYTGRSDCESSFPGFKGYETTREESHPNPVGTGQMTADFFKKDFGLTARQSAALLLGAHSIGSFNFEISQFRYDWTKNNKKLMNNQLFRLEKYYDVNQNIYSVFNQEYCYEASILCGV